ncbi:hypothetical protein [Kiloniella sp.]|uniref:hypothetical protein n=1 Tax=Kiloniella sp. TaxID=1938587 RepID=UPI003A8DD1D3
MDIYENIIIGNFLVGLGHQIGRINSNLPFNVNLLQQTPLDKSIGDVLMERADFIKIIEFKRQVNTNKKEQTKHTILSRALNDHKLHDVSREIHWLVSHQNTEKELVVKSAPYLDFNTGLETYSLTELIKDTADELTGKNVPKHKAADYESYIKLLQTLNGRNSDSSGAIILCSSSEGGLNYMPVNSLENLRFSLNQIDHLFKNNHEKKLQQEKKRSYQKERSYGRSL